MKPEYYAAEVKSSHQLFLPVYLEDYLLNHYNMKGTSFNKTHNLQLLAKDYFENSKLPNGVIYVIESALKRDFPESFEQARSFYSFPYNDHGQFLDDCRAASKKKHDSTLIRTLRLTSRANSSSE